MKRLRIAAVVVAVALLGNGCGGQKTGEEGTVADDVSVPENFRVGLVFDVGGKGDKSFNDSAYQGLMQALADFPIAVSDFEPGQDADREVGLRRLAARGRPTTTTSSSG